MKWLKLKRKKQQFLCKVVIYSSDFSKGKGQGNGPVGSDHVFGSKQVGLLDKEGPIFHRDLDVKQGEYGSGSTEWTFVLGMPK